MKTNYENNSVFVKPNKTIMTTIKAKKDLYNGGKCFTKGKTYQVSKVCKTEASLIDSQTINDQGQPHIVGLWWREFKIISS